MADRSANIELSDDPTRKGGGYAVLTFSGVGDVETGNLTLRVKRQSATDPCLGPVGWQASDYAFAPLGAELSDGDLQVSVGPEIVDRIEEFTPVEITIREAGLSGVVVWEGVTYSFDAPPPEPPSGKSAKATPGADLNEGSTESEPKEQEPAESVELSYKVDHSGNLTFEAEEAARAGVAENHRIEDGIFGIPSGQFARDTSGHLLYYPATETAKLLSVDTDDLGDSSKSPSKILAMLGAVVVLLLIALGAAWYFLAPVPKIVSAEAQDSITSDTATESRIGDVDAHSGSEGAATDEDVTFSISSMTGLASGPAEGIMRINEASGQIQYLGGFDVSENAGSALIVTVAVRNVWYRSAETELRFQIGGRAARSEESDEEQGETESGDEEEPAALEAPSAEEGSEDEAPQPAESPDERLQAAREAIAAGDHEEARRLLRLNEREGHPESLLLLAQMYDSLEFESGIASEPNNLEALRLFQSACESGAKPEEGYLERLKEELEALAETDVQARESLRLLFPMVEEACQ